MMGTFIELWGYRNIGIAYDIFPPSGKWRPDIHDNVVCRYAVEETEMN